MSILEKVIDLLVPSAHAFDTHEHIKVVDKACSEYMSGLVIEIRVKDAKSGEKMRFTLGEVSALAGDYYATPSEFIYNAAKARQFLDENNDEFRKGDPSQQQEAAKLTGGKYLDMAIVNYDHFRNSGNAPSAVASMKRYHGLACSILMKPATRHQSEMDSHSYAYLHEGFALHYAMDLFSAGHLRGCLTGFGREQGFVFMWRRGRHVSFAESLARPDWSWQTVLHDEPVERMA